MEYCWEINEQIKFFSFNFANKKACRFPNKANAIPYYHSKTIII